MQVPDCLFKGKSKKSKKRLIICPACAIIVWKKACLIPYMITAFVYNNMITEVAALDALKITAGVLLLIACILLIILFLMQTSKQSGLSPLTGSSDSYFSKNKSKTLDAKIVNLTRIFVIVFFVLTVALNIFVAHLK